MAIKIKRSTGNEAPSSLAAGQLAYSEGSTNGGTLTTVKLAEQSVKSLVRSS
jgi:hypothetical protein